MKINELNSIDQFANPFRSFLHIFFAFVFYYFASAGAAWAYVEGATERTLVNLPTHKIVEDQTLYVDIGHRFLSPIEKDNADGTGKENPLYDLFGMDDSANISLAVTYGIGNLLDVGLTRYSLSKLYLLDSRLVIWDEWVDSKPFSIALVPNIGFRSDRDIADDRQFTSGIQGVIGKNFWGEHFYISLVPSFQVNENAEDVLNPEDNTLALGGNIAYRYNRLTLAFEANQPLSGYKRENASGNTIPNLGFAIKFRTYQHCFSFVFSNHIYASPADMLAGWVDEGISDTDFRFGFNISREIPLKDDEPKKTETPGGKI